MKNSKNLRKKVNGILSRGIQLIFYFLIILTMGVFIFIIVVLIQSMFY